LQTNSEYGSETVNSAVRELSTIEMRAVMRGAPREGMCRGYSANCQRVRMKEQGFAFPLRKARKLRLEQLTELS